MGLDWAAVAAIGSVLGGLGSVVSSFMTPKVKIPEVKIPEADLQKINAAIEANKGLSDTARQAVQQAIQAYQEGRLTPQYQATLDKWWNDQAKQLSQRLASMGLSNSTIAQSAWNELQTLYLQNMGTLMQKQLQDALSLSGLSTEYVNELMNKVSIEMTGRMQQAQSYLQQYALSQQQAAARSQAFANLSQAASKLEGLGATTQTTPSVELKNLGPIFELPSNNKSWTETLGSSGSWNIGTL